MNQSSNEVQLLGLDALLPYEQGQGERVVASSDSSRLVPLSPYLPTPHLPSLSPDRVTIIPGRLVDAKND
ncbi:hypothetical protein IQ276_016010 [Desmonostoc muscorum LEGE 12446]|uniref:hypothetical protein n=1 Tax=Desmonostoc muscorum TaxID=1179 RepID=UPI001F2ED09F|nr:hypothetical protein [Desmonostoc muscorum]MCF2147901.1 hypothetical protein [Desmonostoc muscorum LEGE 12446]